MGGMLLLPLLLLRTDQQQISSWCLLLCFLVVSAQLVAT